MAKRMAEPAFHAEQCAGLWSEHVAPINRLVDDLNQDPAGRRGAPYVPPMYGGVRSRLLTLSSDPGKAALRGTGGSGFLSVENTGPSAVKMGELLEGAGIELTDVVPWNAYPWDLQGHADKVTSADIDAGARALRRMRKKLRRLRVVLVCGDDAMTGWTRFAERRPLAVQRLDIIKAYSTGPGALHHPDPEVRARREQNRIDAFADAARVLGAGDAHDTRSW